MEIAVKEKPDAIVIAGDIYDKAVPSAEAVEVFDHFIGRLTGELPETEVMMISGNHDSGQRLNCFRSVLSRQRVHMIGLPPQSSEEFIEKVVLKDSYGDVNFYLLPFVKPSMVKMITGVDERGNNLSYNDTLDRLIRREAVDMSPAQCTCKSPVLSSGREKVPMMWSVWIQKYALWEILTRSAPGYWSPLIMRL